MPGQLGAGGFEPRTSPPERRDFFDLRRQITEINANLAALDTRLDTAETDITALEGEVTEWVSFTPSWTNYTRGDGTTTSYKRMVGDQLELVVREVLGATSSVGSTPTMTLPDSLSTLMTPTAYPIGSCIMNDTGTTTIFGSVRLPSATTLDFRPYIASGTYLNVVGSVVTSTVPFTWVSTDFFVIHALIPVAT